MDELLDEARKRDRVGRRIKVLVLVKTTPTPSDQYEDTVCVAGLALEPGPVRWVRLYPIPFRHLDASSKFQKYSIINVGVGRPRNDPRAESLRVDVGTITVTRVLEPWVDRCRVLNPVPSTTACELNAAAAADPNATSLGIVRPLQVGLEVKPHRGWSERQQAVLRKWRNQAALPIDGLPHRDAPPLEHPPLEAWYRYTCEAPECRGHRQGILDWELTALQRKARADGVDVEERVRRNFFQNMFAPDRSQWFILGNNAEAPKRTSFSVLSILWPRTKDVRRADALNSTLF
jgi:hypothetical protein